MQKQIRFLWVVAFGVIAAVQPSCSSNSQSNSRREEATSTDTDSSTEKRTDPIDDKSTVTAETDNPSTTTESIGSDSEGSDTQSQPNGTESPSQSETQDQSDSHSLTVSDSESASDTGTAQEPPQYGIPGQSCEGLDDICLNRSCCDFVSLLGGTFPMGYDSGETAESPEHSVEVSPFHMDVFEVVVGRFRRFVEVYDGVTFPSEGQGAHPLIPGSGWNPAWNALMPATREDLVTALGGHMCNYTSTPGGGAMEMKPMNCVPWYVAEAFCIWDGGRLPTEAEWEFVAAGGDENRTWPFGNEEPLPPADECDYATISGCDGQDVGSAPLGISRYGTYDMAGSVQEWTLDWYAMDFYGTCSEPPCTNPLNLDYGDMEDKVVRGGSAASVLMSQCRASRRSTADPSNAGNSGLGLRCVR